MCNHPRCSYPTAAPESWQTGTYSYDMIPADVYSVGAVLLSLLTGCHPFYTFEFFSDTMQGPILISRHAQKYRDYQGHELTSFVKRDNSVLTRLVQPFDQQLRDLLLASLAIDPQTRITIQQFLAHQWFNDQP